MQTIAVDHIERLDCPDWAAASDAKVARRALAMLHVRSVLQLAPGERLGLTVRTPTYQRPVRRPFLE
jgi:hypothetical protein